MGRGDDGFRQFDAWEESPELVRMKKERVNFDIPEKAWVVWGGRVVLSGAGDVNAGFQEVCRIECPSPRAVLGTLSILGDPTGFQQVDIQLFQGIGRVDLERQFTTSVPSSFDFQLPTRILRLLCRFQAQSPNGPDVEVQAVWAPVYTWLDDRLAKQRGHPQ